MKFTDLGLSDEVLRAVHEAGYTVPTPIQEKAIPVVLMGRDVLGCAQTGTGKTASFTLPMIDILASGRAKARMPRSLILEPTRELAAQVAENFEIYGKYHKLSKVLLTGGTSMEEQLKILNRGVDVLIATPGRLLDVYDRGHLLMNDVKVLVIDEADRMLDMGFIPDVEKIVAMLSPMRTTLLFSATMPKEIRRLAERFLSNPKEISVSAPASTADTITQGLIKLHSSSRAPGAAQKVKRDALRELIVNQAKQAEISNALVFCNRKRDVDVVYKSLEKHGMSVARLHGDMAQSLRTETLDKFKKNEVTLLVCSDVAARGLDISTVSHVFNFDIPTHAEDYVHRIGRTGRAGRKGHAYTFMLPEERKYLDAIEKLIGKPIPVMDLNSVLQDKSAPAKTETKPEPKVEAKAEAKEADNAESGAEAAADKPKRGRSRTKKAPADNRSDSKPANKPEQKVEKKAESKPAPKPEPARSSRNNDANDAIKDSESPWGAHMPAFLTKEVVLSKD